MKIFSKIILFYFIFLFLTVNVSSSSIQLEVTKTFDVTHDATVDSGDPDLNFKSDYLDVRYWELFSSTEEQISYLGFSVDLPVNIIIISINLILEVFFMPLDGHSVPINVWETSSFNEDTITFNNAPALIQIVDTATINENKVWSLSLDKNLLGEKTNYFFAIETDIESVYTLSFYSKDNSFGDPPKLKIIYDDPNVTEPLIPNSVLGLIVIGIVLFGVVGFYYYGKQRRAKNLSKSQSQPSLQPSGFCSNCGNPKALGKTFCGNCGEKY